MTKIWFVVVLVLSLVPRSAGAQEAAPQVDLAVATHSAPDTCHGNTYVISTNTHYQLLGCVEDANGQPVDTNQSDLYLEWVVPESALITPDPPPAETAPDGTVALNVDVDSADTYDITMILCSTTPCDHLASAMIRINAHWHEDCAFNGTGCDGAVIRKTDDGNLFLAIGSSEECMAGRPLLLKKERSGRDLIKRFVQADDFGEASVRIRDRWRGRFYVVAPRWEPWQSANACEPKRSNSVRIP